MLGLILRLKLRLSKGFATYHSSASGFFPFFLVNRHGCSFRACFVVSAQ